MPFDGNGDYAPVGAPDFPAVPSTAIRSTQYNNAILDIATALSMCVTRDGQSPVMANLPMTGYKLTGLGTPSVLGDSLAWGKEGGLSNLTMTTAGSRIKGDFTNATLANRAMVQSSITNGFTNFGLLPNGTATISVFRGYNNSNPTNASYAQLEVNSGAVNLASGAAGTGTFLPLVFLTSGAEQMRIDTAGNVGIGGNSAGEKLLLVGSIDNSGSALNTLDNATQHIYQHSFAAPGTKAKIIFSIGGLGRSVIAVHRVKIIAREINKRLPLTQGCTGIPVITAKGIKQNLIAQIRTAYAQKDYDIFTAQMLAVAHQLDNRLLRIGVAVSNIRHT